MENKRNHIVSFLVSMRAVLWGFLGVRKKSGQDADMAAVSFFHIVIAGVLGAVIFMTTLLLIVRAVVKS